MKRFFVMVLIISVILNFSFTSNAQEIITSKVYLKGGSILVGEIQEYESGIISLKTEFGSFSIPEDKVKFIVVSGEEPKEVYSEPRIVLTNGEVIPGKISKYSYLTPNRVEIELKYEKLILGGLKEIALIILESRSTGEDKTPPKVEITSPRDGETVIGEVNIKVQASDNVGVVRVELYINGNKVGEGTNSPYEFIWNTERYKDKPEHKIKVRAYDGAGNIGESKEITLKIAGTLKWRFETEDWIPSSSTIGKDGTIYVGSWDDYLYAINPDGTLKWKFKTGNNVDSSPAVGKDGTIYVGSMDDYLYAINPDGTLRWKFKTGDDVNSSPAIGKDGTIYVGSRDDYLYAINPDGSLRWKFKTGNAVNSSPAVGKDGTIYVGSRDNYLYAINPDGSLRWKFETGGTVDSSPAIGKDGTIYVGNSYNYFYAINPDGSLRWKFETGSTVDSSPAIGKDGTIYVGSRNNYLYAINPDGTLKWKFSTGNWVRSSPAIGKDGTIYVGSDDNYLYAINPDGTLKWKLKTERCILSSPAIGKDGTIYVGSWDNNLYAIHSTSYGLSDSPWPKFRLNEQNTGCLEE